MRTSTRDERGAVVVLAVVLVALLAFVAAVSVGTVAIVLAHRRAQVAADLAALAAASALQSGTDACAAASSIAGRHEATVTRCVVEGATVVITTAVALPDVVGGRDVAARARAGPQPVPPVVRPAAPR